MRSRAVLGALSLTLALSGCADDTAPPIPRVTQPTELDQRGRDG
jgi:nitrous oxide reductase accessory protein NosL